MISLHTMIILLVFDMVVFCSSKQISQESLVDNEISIMFGGDISFAGIVRYNKINGKCTYNQSFDEVKDVFQLADFTVANLESPLSVKKKIFEETPLIPNKAVHLIAEKDSVEALTYAGIKVVSLANNHYMDYGDEVAISTINILKANKLSYFGVTKNTHSLYANQKPIILEKRGIKIGLLGYCTNINGCGKIREKTETGPALYRSSTVQTDIKALRDSQVNGIVVFMHWGVEYGKVSESMKAHMERIKELQQLGVDAIIGCHAHVTQPHLYYRNMFVAPQIGNFLFPMHLSQHWVFAAHSDHPEIEASEKWWYRYTKNYKNDSARGCVMWLSFKKDGLVQGKTRYMKTEIDVTDNHCLFIKPIGKWIDVCSAEDDNCRGTSECNDFECMVDGNLVKPIEV